jgi:hypothetical protein
MASTITLDNLVEGQEIILPYEVRGTATGNGPARLIAAARQIDNNALDDIGPNCDPQVPDPAGGANPTTTVFAFELTWSECPREDTWYILTIHFWDDQDDCTHFPVTFKAIDALKEVIHAP